jgi:acyl-CoA thioesterase FadM
MKTKAELPDCPVATTVSLIGSKWKLLILRNLLVRPWRFNELRKSLDGISQKVLTDSLRSMEEDGIISPVRSVSCQYKKPCTFGDTLSIAVSVDNFNGVVLTLRYDMTRTSNGELLCAARSEHVFMHRGGGLLRMRRDMPEFCAALEGIGVQP